MTRLYVPATIADLARWLGDGLIPAAALAEAFESPDDTEEGEYAALMSAADSATQLLTGGAGRRVVVVVDSRPDIEHSGPADWSEVVAVHADPADRPAGADPDEELGWYATQEVPDLLG